MEQINTRLVDIVSGVEDASSLLRTLAWDGPLEEVHDYLVSQGMSEERVLEAAVQALLDISNKYYYSTPFPPALIRLLLPFLASHREMVQSCFPQDPRSQFTLIILLAHAQPIDFDLIEQRLEALREEDAPDSALLGVCARRLLEADPVRFTGWARKIATGGSGATMLSRRQALAALMTRGLAEHIDLVVEIARTPLAGDVWLAGYLRRDALNAAYRFDPVQYQPLVEELMLSSNQIVALTALDLLASKPFDAVAPALKRCVEQGRPDIALKAAQALFKQPWEGQQDYAVALLEHRSERVRFFACDWLAKQGKNRVALVSPLLNHRNAGVRLFAVQTLRSIGGDDVTSLLRIWLDTEKSQRVKQAIIDGIGLSGSATAAASGALTIRQLTAKSDAYRHYLPSPFLAWFDLDGAPALRWTSGGIVPVNVLNYLLYLQSRTSEALHPEVEEALSLIETTSAGPLALALYRGWLNNGAKVSYLWLLPLISALADDGLVPHLRRQIEDWELTARRKLTASLLLALARMDSKAAHAEIQSFTKLFRRGYMRRATKAALELAAASTP